MPAKAVDLGAISSSQLVTCQVDSQNVVPTALFGWSVTESTGSAAAKLRVRDGTTVAGPVRSGLISLASGASVVVDLESPIELDNHGIYVEIVSGSADVTIFWG